MTAQHGSQRAVTATKGLQRQRAMRRAGVVGAVVNLVLAVAKVGIGLVGQSTALVADGIHSLSDMVTDLMVWFAAVYSNQPPDKDHPYGHGRIETAFTVVLGIVLMLTAVGIIIDAGQRLIDPQRLLEPTPVVLIVAAISILANEGLYRYTAHLARRHRSQLLHANAWHHRSDAVSSIVVLVGVAGSLAGLTYLDAFAAAAVALMIARIGWQQASTATRELVDTGLEPEHLSAIHGLIAEVEGVHDLHLLRTRSMAGQILVDAHIEVSPRLSVSEGHQVGEFVRDRLLESDHDIIDVTLHIDPEDDEQARKCRGLPLRREVLADLRHSWHDLLPEDAFNHVTLHYLNGKIDVELVLPWSGAADSDPTRTATRLQQAAAQLDWLRTVQVLLG